MQPTALIIDGNSLMHRAFHALPDMQTKSGTQTGAVYGFISMLLRVVAEQKPAYLAVAFDLHGPTFRHSLYTDYKAGRKPTDEALRPQFPLLRELLTAMTISQVTCESYEADDILGTLAQLFEAAGVQPLLVTGDRDALQLVSDQTRVIYTKRGITDTVLFTAEAVKAYWGVTPAQVPDLKGLMGDSSDHIPGVPGVGEKTAAKLLNQFGTLEATLDNAETQLTGALRQKLMDHADLARLSKQLATIDCQAPLGLDLEILRTGDFTQGGAMFDQLEFHSLKKRLLALSPSPEQTSPVPVKTPAAETAVRVLASPEAIAGAIAGLRPGLAALHLGDTLTMASQDGTCLSIPLAQDLLTTGFTPEEALALAAPLWSNGRPLVVHEGKRLLLLLSALDLPLPCVQHDVMLAAYLLNPLAKSFALGDLAGGRADAAAILALLPGQQDELAEQGMLSLYEDVEMPLMHALFAMERAGFLVDGEVLRRLGAGFAAQLESLRTQVYTLTGVQGFNLNSPKQLGEVLFDTLHLPAGRKTKSGWSTDAETLEALADAHPAIPLLLQYRQLAKLQGTYIEGLLRLMGTDGRIHTWFDQVSTATGRISSIEPNLQNIPVRTPLGREIRRAFIAPPGHALVDADYSQIELRLLAHLSGDQGMTQAFLTGQDIHTQTAALVYEVPLDEVTSEMRSAAKAVNFGIVYGISDYGLARNIGITKAQAAEFIQRYFQRFPGVKAFMDRAVTLGRAQGYSTTLLGRRRPLPEINSSNYNTRSFGERAAMNTPVQGSAADIIKLAMVRVAQALAQGSYQARLILQVHDELIVECPHEEVERVSQLLKDCMEQALPLSVPLTAEVHHAPSWFDAK